MEKDGQIDEMCPYFTTLKKTSNIFRTKSSEPMYNIIVPHLRAATVSNIFDLLVKNGLLISARSSNTLIISLKTSCKLIHQEIMSEKDTFIYE